VIVGIAGAGIDPNRRLPSRITGSVGMDRLTKPFVIAELTAVIDALLADAASG
jgi:hypothetical protein